jgi:cytochrome P450
MASVAPFYPAQPRRVPDWPAVWRGFFGERLRNTVYGWPEPAFDVPIRTRKVLGFTVHILNDPDAIERVMLDNKANYERPAIARRVLAPILGNGLFSAEGDDWRKQRRLVAPTFAPGAVAGMTALMDAAALREVAAWPAAEARLDLAGAATRTTMAIPCSAAMPG